MLTADQIREELVRQLDSGDQVGAEVARHLNIAPARVTEMRNRTRRVQQREMEPLAQLLGMTPTPSVKLRPIEATDRIRHLGKVAQGVWLEESMVELDPDEFQFVDYDRERGDPPPTDLFAVTPDGTSMKDAFMPGVQLICRRIPFGIGELKSGDYAIIERTAHDLHELTCKRVEIDADGIYWLHSETDDERFQEPWRAGRPDENAHHDVEIVAIAKVIRAVKDYERGRV